MSNMQEQFTQLVNGMVRAVGDHTIAMVNHAFEVSGYTVFSTAPLEMQRRADTVINPDSGQVLKSRHARRNASGFSCDVKGVLRGQLTKKELEQRKRDWKAMFPVDIDDAKMERVIKAEDLITNTKGVLQIKGKGQPTKEQFELFKRNWGEATKNPLLVDEFKRNWEKATKKSKTEKPDKDKMYRIRKKVLAGMKLNELEVAFVLAYQKDHATRTIVHVDNVPGPSFGQATIIDRQLSRVAWIKASK